MINNKIVLCVELNKQFPSIRNAAQYLKIDPSGISKVIRGKQKTAGGYTWINLNKSTDEKIKSVNEKSNKTQNLFYTKQNNNKLSQEEIDYWIKEFINDSKDINSLEDLNNSLKNLYKSLIF